MPWMDTDPMTQRTNFIADWRRSHEDFSALCRTYGISRKTGYKWVSRYEAGGLPGLQERSRSRIDPGRMCPELEEAIVRCRGRHPTWGPRKLRDILAEELGDQLPAASTMGDVLKRWRLVKPRRRRRLWSPTSGTSLRAMDAPNAVWCVDFKGEFKLGNGSYCYPLTVTDGYSRFLLACEAEVSTAGGPVRRCFEELFSSHGVPRAIRSDNGTPFAGTGVARLSQLSVWLMTLGITVERIAPGCPQQNGRHERMHRTLKQETTRPPRRTFSAQQRAFDDFRDCFNHERPHEALGMRTPASCYRRAPDPQPIEPGYPGHYEVRRVGANGCFKWLGRDVFLNSALSGRDIGLVEEDEDVWAVYFLSLKIALWEPKQAKVFGINQS